MPKISDFGDLQVAYPDLVIPAGSEMLISVGGKDYNLTPDQLRQIIGAAGEETGAEIGAKLDAEYGTDWRATPTEGAPLLDEDDFASDSATAAPSQQSTEARITSKISTATAPLSEAIDLRAVSATLAATGGGLLIGCTTPDGYTATNVQGLLDEFAAAIALRALSSDTLDVDDATPVLEAAIGDTDYVLFEKNDGTSFGKAQKGNLGLGGAIPNIQSGTAYTLAAEDAGRLIIMDSSSANTVTIPANATAGLPVGFTCSVSQGGAGTTTIAGESATVVVGGAAGGSFDVDARFGIVVLVKTGTNAWYATGDRGVTIDSTAPTIDTLSPADGATDVSLGTPLIATFSEAIKVGTGNVVLRDNDGGFADLETFNIATGTGGGGGTVVVNGNQLIITPGAAMVAGIEHAVRIAGTCIDDLADNSYAGIADDTSWSFTTAAASAGPEIVASSFHEVSVNTGSNTLPLPAVGQVGDHVLVVEVSDATLNSNIPGQTGAGGYTVIYLPLVGSEPAIRVSHKVLSGSPDTTVTVNANNTRPVSVGIVLIRGAHADLDGLPATVAPNQDQGPFVVPAYTQTNADVLRIYAVAVDDDAVTLTGVGGDWVTLVTGFTSAASGNNCSLIIEYLPAGGAALDEVAPGTVTGTADQWSAIHLAFKAA